LKVNKLLAAVALSAVALGSLVALGGTASAHPAAVARPAILPSGTMTVTPNKNLVDGEKVTVKVSGIGGGGPNSTPNGIYVGQCDSRAAAGTQDPTWCDRNLADGANNDADTDGSGTFTLTIHTHTGVDFLATHPGANCSYSAAGHACILVAANDPTAPTEAALAYLYFKNPAVATTTSVKASVNKAKAGTNVAFVAKVVHKGKVTGKVTFFDNGKKFAVVKLASTGLAKAKHKIAVGANKITASYAGDVNNKSSKSKPVTVTGTKPKK
jgi:Bacterial Ig-like domain (group 3)